MAKLATRAKRVDLIDRVREPRRLGDSLESEWMRRRITLPLRYKKENYQLGWSWDG